jgi:hypothetical protein
MRALEAATRELAALGRGIGQLARALHQTHFEADRIRLDRLTQLSEAIDSTREAVRALSGSSRRSWGAD